MLVNSNALLEKAFKEGYAIPAYNINNLEWIRYILEACSEDKSPVILGVSHGAINYMGGYKVVHDLVKALIDDLKISIPVVLHLDHGKDFESCKKAIDAGFTSVMIDASKFDLEENINITNKVISYASKRNVSVEAEIGKLGNDEQSNLPCYADLQEATDLALETGINSLAPAIGNVHGVYKGEPKLDFELLGSICKNVKIPLVLHGASGLDDNKIKTAIFCGVSKININTELQCAWASAVKEYIKTNPGVYDPRKIISAGEKNIKALIHEKNVLFGCVGKKISLKGAI